MRLVGVKMIADAITAARNPANDLPPIAAAELLAFCAHARRQVPSKHGPVPAFRDPGAAVFRRIVKRNWPNDSEAYTAALKRRRSDLKQALEEVGRGDELERVLALHLAGKPIQHFLRAEAGRHD